MEPIKGEAGIILPPDGYLKKCAQICEKNRVLLLCDEVQTGLGRTGALLACDHEFVRPDGLLLGKALGGGLYPVSMFLAKRELMDVFTPGTHGSTFGGNPLASAIAAEGLKILQEEDLIGNARRLGEYFLQKLRSIHHSAIVDVRGKGLLIGVEFNPARISARQVCERLFHKGVLSKETHETVVRFAPPLVINKTQIDWAVAQFIEVLNTI